jgi:purine-binding chemotaxis protein CheW
MLQEAVNSRESGVRPSLVCRVGGRLCALPLASVIETMRPLPARPIEGAPELVVGVAIVRGSPTVVVDAARLFDGPGSRPARFVTLRVGQRVIALSVDEVVGVRNLSSAGLDGVPGLLEPAVGEAVSAIGTLDAELLLVLDAMRLVPEELLHQLAVEARES